METPPIAAAPAVRHQVGAEKEPPLGVNDVRLNRRQWVFTLLITGLFVLLTPRVWERIERFETGPDYRITYQLSKDYWLYSRWLRHAAQPAKIVVLGDSVVWGEYVLPNGTLSHFLNVTTVETNRFVNGGLNGLFPLAQEGLIDHYAASLRNRKVVLHCNVLWMTSPKADLSAGKEQQFNHSRLVPQFYPRIPCYRADANERLSAVLQRHVEFLSWVGHLQDAYFGQKSILDWTLEDDGAYPPHYPHCWKNPLTQITFRVPSAPAHDPQRGPDSPRHKPWSSEGRGTTSFEWVGLDRSLQWRAFQRVVARLRARGNDVLVVLGPFNEHMVAEDNLEPYREIRAGIAAWLRQEGTPVVIPEVLPSALYADASHPLTAGYELLAKRLLANATFQNWLESPHP
ncbi:MAG TPA: hypothetical protein VG146_13660 [Verrucomicrobiae bacterium]|nr:hypothetical protein [Verrucomicrobiae bacterium]